jgi:hypothetical protein
MMHDTACVLCTGVLRPGIDPITDFSDQGSGFRVQGSGFRVQGCIKIEMPQRFAVVCTLFVCTLFIIIIHTARQRLGSITISRGKLPSVELFFPLASPGCITVAEVATFAIKEPGLESSLELFFPHASPQFLPHNRGRRPRGCIASIFG